VILLCRIEISQGSFGVLQIRPYYTLLHGGEHEDSHSQDGSTEENQRSRRISSLQRGGLPNMNELIHPTKHRIVNYYNDEMKCVRPFLDR
jgi:hypothetical protein